MTSSIKKYLVGLGFFGVLLHSNLRAESDFQLWTQLQPKYNLSETTSLFGFAQFRLGRGNADQILTDIGITHLLGSFGMEAGFTTLSKISPLFSKLEWRPWIGVNHTFLLGKVKWVNRFRTEIRFLSGVPNVSIRLRILSGLAFPAIDSDGRFHPFVDNELFLNLNSESGGPNSGFDQNRARVGIRWPIAKAIKLEGSYMNLWLNQPNTDLFVHVPFLVLLVDTTF